MDNNTLKAYGIDVGLLISGLFGAILLTSKGSAMNITRTLSSLIGGHPVKLVYNGTVMHELLT